MEFAREQDPPEPLQPREDNKNEERKSSDPPFVGVPHWFVENCVKTPVELDATHIPLVIRTSKSLQDQASALELNQSDVKSNAFEIELVVYEALRTVLATSAEGTEYSGPKYTSPFFIKDFVSLRVPGGEECKGAPAFLRSIIEHFAQAIRGTIMTLNLEDIEELALVFSGAEKIDFLDECLGIFFGESGEASNSTKIEFPFRMLLHSSQLKTAESEKTLSGSIPTSAPIVIHVPDAHQFQFYGYHNPRGNILKPLRRAFSGSSNILLIFSSHLSGGDDWAGTDGHIFMAPVKSTAQKRLFETGLENNDSIPGRNIRMIQRHIRGYSVVPAAANEPYASWTFLDGAQRAKAILSNQLFSGRDVLYFAQLINRCVNVDAIPKAIEDGQLRREFLDDWSAGNCNDGWGSFPVSIQAVIHAIEQDSKRYELEQQLLDLVVRPDSLYEGWSDIEMDEEDKNAIVQMVTQPAKADSGAYGILKRGHVGGALLYGPPGTGKTHLARVLAHECQATMISVSYADIESMWVGETEKTIKALFNLGRMVAPSIIFFDEADSLFQARSSNGHAWQRSRVNQLLSEMDGLLNFEKSPFVLLASNFPLQIDYAVLRRAPFRLHMGLPSGAARKQIFRICLREEELAYDIDFITLSAMTPGYSGSDIKAACIQAALISEKDTADADRGQKRILGFKCFKKALNRIQPTVSQTALLQITEFARDHDYSTWLKLDTTLKGKEHVLRPSNARMSPGGMENESSPMEHCPPIARAGQHCQPSFLSDISCETNSHSCLESTAKSCPEAPNSCAKGATAVDALLPSGAENECTSTNRSSPIYRPLLDSKHIRILSISPVSPNNDNSSPEPIRCTLETVSLDDYTPRYMTFRGLESHNVETTARVQLAFWHAVSTCDAALDKNNDGTVIMDELRRSKDHCARLCAKKDVPLEELGKIEPRWSWGDYIALSYVWGDSSNKQDIFVNDQSFLVNRNLFQALLELRRSFEVREASLKVWIDAICINQQDTKEREFEVKKMQSIYSMALTVRGWIGSPQIGATEFAMAREWLNGVRTLEVSELTAAHMPNHEVSEALVTLVSALFSEPYWDRLWIIQENVLASSLTLWYGCWRFTVDEVTQLFELIMRDELLGSSSETLMKFVSDIWVRLRIVRVCLRIQLLRQGERRYQDAPLYLLESLLVSQLSRATDHRDKVYGILAILPQSISSQIQPDYSTRPDGAKAYIMLSRACIQVERGLHTLARAMVVPSPLDDFPTWAFDLSSGNYCHIAPSPEMIRREYAADKGRDNIPKFSQDSRTLFCEGLVVDTIASMGATLQMPFKDTFKSVPIEPPSQVSVVNEEPYSKPVDEKFRLALARVFRQDSSYSFADGPSLLDMPWFTMEELLSDDQNVHCAMTESDSRNTESGSQRTFSTSMWHKLVDFQSVIHCNENFIINGTCLRHYFTSEEDFCSRPDHFSKLLPMLFQISLHKRLCTTTDGLIGTVPSHTRLGDRVAVLFGCDMPVVLRPRGEQFEFVGGCFVEGLMNGEAIEKLEQGHFQVEKISIC